MLTAILTRSATTQVATRKRQGIQGTEPKLLALEGSAIANRLRQYFCLNTKNTTFFLSNKTTMFQPEHFDYRNAHPGTANLLEGFSDRSDLILTVLQKATYFSLTPEQLDIARASALKLAQANKEIYILDLVHIWSNIPALSDFANVLRYYCLPA